MRFQHAFCFAAWLVACAGCGTDDAPADDGGASEGRGDAMVLADAAADAAPPPAIDPTQLVGDFGLKIVPEMVDPMPPMNVRAAHTTFIGKLFDKPKVPLIQFELTDMASDCELLVPNNAFCDPPCAGSVCTHDGCVPDAVAQSVAGPVRVLGIGDEERMLSPITSSPTYQVASLPYPPCAEGDTVRVEAAAFSVETPCIAPLDVASDAVRVRSGEATALTWEPPGEPGVSRIGVELDISHHGGQTGQIDCDVPDTGSFEIPEVLVTQLIALGVAGYPTITVTRVSRAAADAAPNVTLTVSSPALRPVDTGMPSCSREEDCPDGQSCDLDRLICR